MAGTAGADRSDARERIRLPVVYALPGMEGVAVRRDLPYARTAEGDLLMDVYAPPETRPGARRPAVVFVHGGPVPAPPVPVKDWAVFTS